MSHTTLGDREIVALYFERDERAIEHTVRKYGDYCFTIANNILRCREDAEECVNDTWLKTWNTVPPQKPNSLRHYLAKITRNFSISRWREQNTAKRGGGELTLALGELEDFLADTREVEDEAARAAFADCLNRFLRGLPARECHIFLRRYFYVETTGEIARRYGMKEANVLLILSRTRAKLRTHLEQEGYTV